MACSVTYLPRPRVDRSLRRCANRASHRGPEFVGDVRVRRGHHHHRRDRRHRHHEARAPPACPRFERPARRHPAAQFIQRLPGPGHQERDQLVKERQLVRRDPQEPLSLWGDQVTARRQAHGPAQCFQPLRQVRSHGPEQLLVDGIVPRRRLRSSSRTRRGSTSSCAATASRYGCSTRSTCRRAPVATATRSSSPSTTTGRSGSTS